MNLIINSVNLGECQNYEQHRKEKQWVFKMENFEIRVDFDKIRIFNSCGTLEIITF